MQVLADAGRSLLTERHLPELPDSPATDDRPDGAQMGQIVQVQWRCLDIVLMRGDRRDIVMIWIDIVIIVMGIRVVGF